MDAKMNVNNLTVKGLWETLKKNIIWIMLFIIIAQGCLFLYQKYAIVPEYNAQAEILVSENKSTDAKSVEDVSNNIQLINTYTAVLKSSKIMDIVKKEGNFDKETKDLLQNLTVTSDEKSLVFNITYSGIDKAEVKSISKLYVQTVQKELPKLFTKNSITVLENPETEITQQGYSNNVITLLVSMILSILFILIRCAMDKRVKTKEQLTRMGLIYLGDIPMMTNKSVGQKGE